MKIDPECRICIVNWVYQRTSPHVPEQVRSYLRDTIGRAVGNRLSETTNVGFLCNRAVFATEEFSPDTSPYYETFKQRSNEQAGGLLNLAEAYIEGGFTERERIERACFLAAAGNVAPLAAPSGVFTFQEVRDLLEGRLQPVITGNVYEAVSRSKQVLYVTDNAGEVGFDMLLLKRIKEKGAFVTLVVKEDVFFEDVTTSDAHYFNLEHVVDEIVLSKGFFVREEASSTLNRAYALSDLVIAKGTGSFEALRGETANKKTVFMLKVKCKPISRAIAMEEGRDRGALGGMRKTCAPKGRSQRKRGVRLWPLLKAAPTAVAN